MDRIAEWCLLICVVVLTVWGMVHALSKQHRRSKQVLDEWSEQTEESDELEEPPLIEKHVTVMDKLCVSEVVGVRYPEHRDVYQLAVRYDDGNVETLTVEKMIFDTVPLHSRGTLAFVGDRVYGYCED